MKHIFKALILICVVFLYNGCDEKVLEPAIKDSQAPGPVVIKSVTSLPGGLRIEYSLPRDKDLLYVKAVYTLSNGVSSEVKASYFDSKLEILGFADVSQHTVKLYAVDRSENMSVAAECSGTPLEAPVNTIATTITLAATFGGARVEWLNETEANVAILLFAEDSLTGKLQNVHTIYTEQKTGKFNLRGYKAIPIKFAALVRDRWDNYSDTIKPPAPYTLTPWIEEKLDKTKFQKIILANDTDWDAWEGNFEYVFDDNFSSFCHSWGDHAWPQIITIDLGVKVKLSRFRLYQRSAEQSYFLYSHGNPKKYEIYGSPDLPSTSGDLSEWIKLREECVSVKPSGDGPLTEEDLQHAIEGDEYDVDPVEVRYIRIAINDTWDGAGFINFVELSFWGNETGKCK